MQAGVGRQAMEKSAANTNTLSRFETEMGSSPLLTYLMSK